MKNSHHRTEEHLSKKIQELETSLANQTSLVNTQKTDITTINSTLTEAIRDIHELKENPAELSQEAINSKVNDILKQKDFESHWQCELDKTAQKLVFKNLKRTPATANLHLSKVFEEYILQPMNVHWEDKAMMTPTSVIDLN